MKDNTSIMFAGINVTKHVTIIREAGHFNPSRTLEMDIEQDVKDLGKLKGNQKIKDAYKQYEALMACSDDYQEADITTYREINYNIIRNYRNIVVEEIVEVMDAWNEFIDFPEFQLAVINMAYEFDIESDDLK